MPKVLRVQQAELDPSVNLAREGQVKLQRISSSSMSMLFRMDRLKSNREGRVSSSKLELRRGPDITKPSD